MVVMPVVLLHVGLAALAIHSAAAVHPGAIHAAISSSRLHSGTGCGSAALLGSGSAGLLCHDQDSRHCKNCRDRKY